MGEQTQIPEDWVRYRAYLRLLASAGIQPQLRAKLDASDLVQQTLVQAVEGLSEFRGTTEAEMMGWLKRILVNNIAMAARQYSRQKRDVKREHTIHSAVDSSAIMIEKLAETKIASPAEKVIRAEAILKISQAIELLPPGQREAIDLHHWQGLTISQVADQMDRSTTAVAGLIKRGLKAIRSSIVPDSQ